jgi:hypothetical protein
MKILKNAWDSVYYIVTQKEKEKGLVVVPGVTVAAALTKRSGILREQ